MKWLLAPVAFLAALASIPAAPPAAAPIRTNDQLVEQLGSESFTEREAASTAFEQRGEAAITALETALGHSNPEISKRAGEVLANLRRSADTKNHLTPKRVRLSLKNIPLGTAVNDLRARTGINIALDSPGIANPLRLVSCETDELPPWEALAAFCRAANLKEVFAAELDVPKQEKHRRGYYLPPPPPPSPDAVPIRLADGKFEELPGNRSTAVRVLSLPGSFPAHRVFLGTGDVQLHFDVAPLPGLHWRDVSGIRITRVVDSEGRRGAGSTIKAPFSPGGEFFDGPVFVGGRGLAMRWDGDMPVAPTTYPNPRVFPVPIRVATTSARSLKLLEGAVVCEIAMPNQPLVVIEDITRRAGEAVAGSGSAKLTVVESRKNTKGRGAQLQVQTEMPSFWVMMSRRFFNGGGGAFVADPSLQSGMETKVKGFDAAGKPVRMTMQSASEISNEEATTVMVWQLNCPDGLPVKLVLTGPKAVMVEVPFRMENVPLP